MQIDAGLFNIRFDDQKLNKIEQALRDVPRALPRVMSRGLNRTATQARTEVSRNLSRRIGLRVKDVRSRVTLQKASYSNWRSVIKISKKRLPLIKLKAKQTRAGVTYKFGRSRILVRHAFIATMPSGHTGVFRRKATARLPIAELRGPSLGQIFTDAQDEANRIYRQSLVRLEKNIMDQVNLILAKRIPA